MLKTEAMKLIKNVRIVNEGKIRKGSVLIKGSYIYKVYNNPNPKLTETPKTIIDGCNRLLIPGVIDMHVHFREPGLTHKGDTESETRAAVAGGVTSYAEMPNTIPMTISREAFDEKHQTASKQSYINYSYYPGAYNENKDIINSFEKSRIPGVKVFLGASTGNMQIEGDALLNIFNQKQVRVTAHCEDDGIIKQNTEAYKKKYGEDIPFKYHRRIRSSEACLKSTTEALSMAKKYGTSLHIAHLSTSEEAKLLSPSIPLRKKQISSEVCIHHLWFNAADYEEKGAFIKWNPSIKTEDDRQELLRAVKDDRIDIIVTDHAPHTAEEKNNVYTKAPSGGPMVQHSLQAGLELSKEGYFNIETLISKMCHAPAELFGIEKRGFIREGYFADLVLIDDDNEYTVSKQNILYKCGWSPMEGETFHSVIDSVLVNGQIIYEHGKFGPKGQGEPLKFDI